jgi:hypothetical protein
MATVATVAVTEALTTTAERVAALALSAPDPDLMVPATPGWSVTDVLGHLALEPTRNRDLILGRGQWPSEVVDLPAFNGQQIRSLPTRNVSDLAATLRAEVAIMLATAADFGDEPTMMKSDATNGSEPTGTGTLLGEFAVHGHFIARSGVPGRLSLPISRSSCTGCTK